MIVTVINKKHISGKSRKTLKWINGIIINSTYEDNSIIGGIGEKSFWLDGCKYPDDYIVVGCKYRIEEKNGYISKFIKEEN